MNRSVVTPNAPAAIGPYSQAVIHDSTIYVSGQLPIVPSTGAFPGPDITSQTKQCLENLQQILKAAGSSTGQVIKTTVFLQDIGDFSIVNDIYAQYFQGPVLPARAAVQVAALPKGAKIEIEAIASIS